MQRFVKFIIILNVYVFNCFASAGNKSEQDSSGWFIIPFDTLNSTFMDLHFFNENEGWVISGTYYPDLGGNRLRLAYTNNSGKSWDTTRTILGSGYYITFSSKVIGLSGDAVILRTQDEGNMWGKVISLSPEIKAQIIRMEFANDSVAWGSGGRGSIIKSTDTGLTWEILYSDSAAGVFWGLCVLDENTIYAIGGSTLIFTEDGGDNWIKIPFPEQFQRMEDVKFLNKNYGWIIGEFRTILRTTDGGTTWEDQSPKQTGNERFNSIDALDSNTAIAVANEGAIFRTTNGKYWEEQVPETVFHTQLTRVQIINKNAAYIVGDNIILKTTTAITSIPEEPIYIEEYTLSQNYPNPFNPSTKISYSIPKGGVVTIKVYDMLGREMKTLTEEYQDKGEYSLNFEASELTSGVYFYTIRVNEFSLSRKMILLK